MISPVTSHSEVQEESHSIAQDPPQQRPGSGIEKYGTKVMAHIAACRLSNPTLLSDFTLPHLALPHSPHLLYFILLCLALHYVTSRVKMSLLQRRDFDDDAFRQRAWRHAPVPRDCLRPWYRDPQRNRSCRHLCP